MHKGNLLQYWNSKSRKLLVIGAFVIIAISLSAVLFSPVKQWVSAQVAGQTLEVSPPTQEVSIKPGTRATVKTTIRNSSNQKMNMIVSIEGFIATGDEGQVALTSNNPYSVASWTTVSPEKFTLNAGSEQEVTATITVPEGAAGGRYGSFLFSSVGDEKRGQATVTQQIASLFLVKVEGATEQKLTIDSFTAPKFSEFGPIPFSLTFANTGNVHVKTFGIINVQDMFGKTAADVVVTGTNVFPGAQRSVQASMDKTFLFGPYKATALLYYGDTNEVITQTISFFVFPVRIAVGALVVTVILFLLRKRIGKAMKALFGK